MEEFVSLVVFFLLASCPATMQQQPNDACKDFSSDYFHQYDFLYTESPYFTSRYADLYQKFEESLINNSKLLGKLRTGFISKEDIPIHFSLKLELMNGTDIKCKDYSDKYTTATFCPNTSSPGSPWILCHNTLGMTFSSQPLSSLQAKEKKQSIDYSIRWLSILHGSLPAAIGVFLSSYDDSGWYRSDVSLTLRIDKLDCNPSLNLTKCVLSELLSWIIVYSEFGGKSLNWDQSKKGAVTIGHYDDYGDADYSSMNFIHVQMDAYQFIKLSLAEYVFVSTSLALVIAKYFPGVHDQIVSRATRLEHQSLYWGTAVVSNVFVYGLLLTAGRVFGIFLATLLIWDFNRLSSVPITLSIQEVVVFLILIFGATIALTRRDSVRDIPIPKQMAKVLINLSFCWSCFCCCVCCPKRCRAKTLRVFVVFSFMNFSYHSIMDLISIVFTLFIEENRATILTVTLLYTSLLVFLVFLISLIFFHDRNHDVTCCKQLISRFSCACVLITVFGAVMLMVIIYMIIVFSLNLQGFSGILTGLIPTIALSAASWYIKTKLLQRAQRHTNQDRSRPGGSDMCINDREREENTDDDHKMLLP